MSKQTVNGFEGVLERDPLSNALVNVDSEGFKAFMQRKQEKESTESRMQAMELRILRLETILGMIQTDK